MLKDPETLIADFRSVAELAGIPIAPSDIRHEVLRGPDAECRVNESCAVYVFSASKGADVVLKVGKVGLKSGPRFVYQHYSPNSSGSNLSKSLLRSPDFWPKLGVVGNLDEGEVGTWLKANTDRDHFFVLSNDALLTSLLEVFLQCRLKPLFEG